MSNYYYGWSQQDYLENAKKNSEYYSTLNVKKINELLTNEFGDIRDLHEEYYVFTLTYEKLINIYKEMSDSKNTRYNCKLLCENVNISLTLEILEFENDHYMTLPKFQLSVF